MTEQTKPADGATPRRPSGLRALAGKVQRRLWNTEEFRIYRVSATRARTFAPTPRVLAVNAWEQLAFYQPDNAWDPPPEVFRTVVENRRANGHLVFTLVENGLLIHHSWINTDATRIVTDFDQEYLLSSDSVFLYDDNTHSSARGRGLQRRSLEQRMAVAAQLPGVRWMYGACNGVNWPSRKNIERTGMEYHISLFRSRRLGSVRLWSSVAP